MTNQQAASKAKKKWGKSYYVRNGESMSSPEQRSTSLATVQAARAEINRIDAEVKRRLSECDWYQELQSQRRVQAQKIRKTEGSAMYHRFSVGKTNGMFNEILGQGDTWEEAFEQADNRQF